MNTFVEDLEGRPRAWGLEVALEAFVGLTAMSGGLTLAFTPYGSRLVPLSLLDGTPFQTFIVPGLLLAFVVGGLNLTAALLTLRNHPFASPVSMIAGGSLVMFIFTESLMIKDHSPLQLAYFSLGLVIAILSLPKPKEKRHEEDRSQRRA